MSEGLILGCLTWLSFVFSFKHLPFQIKKFLLKNFFITDLLSISISFFLLTGISKSIIAVVAAMVCGLLVNVTLIVYNFFT